MDKESYVSSIRHAVELAGGCDALANRIGVTSEEVVGWMDGTHMPGTEALLLVLDVVIVETRDLANAVMAFGLAELTLAKAAASAQDVTRES